MVVERCNRRVGCETIHPTQKFTSTETIHPITKVYFNEFVANVLHDNKGIFIFDLQGHGGC